MQPAHPWLDLLHREQDGDLSSAEREVLLSFPAQDQIQQQRQALAQLTGTLRDLPLPATPHSIAAQSAADIALSARLSTAPVPSVAAQVHSDIATARQLQAAPVPKLPHSVAALVAAEIAWSARSKNTPLPPMPRSVAYDVSARIQSAQTSPDPAGDAEPPASLPARQPARPSAAAVSALVASTLPRRNPAPLVLVVSLMVGLTLLAVTTAWPNLAAGALVLRTLLSQVSPLAGVGLLVLLFTSALITWRPTPAMRQLGAGAFALSAALTLPALATLTTSGAVTFGRDVTISGPVNGNVIAVGGNIHLQGTARVQGEVVTLLGNVQRAPGAQVSGRVNALLGQASGDHTALETKAPSDLTIATAAAFRPVLGWLGSAAWPQIFVVLTGGALLLLFVAGLAPMLARRQRHAPMRTLALGILTLTALLGPALGLALVGLLGPALIATALAVVLIAVGLSVSAYDAGRAVALRAQLPVPNAVGAMLGLSAVAASLSQPPLAIALALTGGAWGAGTLLLTRVQKL